MSVFQFKHFSVVQERSAMKVGTDALLLGSLTSCANKKYALDVGAGTGVLALMLAQQNLTMRIDAVERDSEAAKECKLNFENAPWSDRLTVTCADIVTYDPPMCYDLIVCNPPYHRSSNPNVDTRKAQARHELYLPIPALVEKLSSLISEEGHIWLIFPTDDHDAWVSAFASYACHVTQLISIIGKEGNAPIREVVAFSKLNTALTTEQVLIRNADATYSDQYKNLTREFHGMVL